MRAEKEVAGRDPRAVGRPLLRVLVVDDDPDLRIAIRRVLERRGHTTILAEDAVQARRLLEASAPDVVLIDIVLPGLEGREAANWMLAQRPDLPIVYMSGFTNSDTVQLPPGRFLRKPFTSAELLARLESACTDPV